jgi:glucose-1-phosphate cytidylyltransferase
MVGMKAVILAGGLGSRLGEETNSRPKPLVEIDGKPILWHIMKTYSLFGVNDFIICLGYKGHMIKEFFANYFLHMSDVTIDIASNEMQIHQNSAEPWRVTLVDTGADTMTGGRLRRVAPYVADEEAFCMTYGDGVSDLDIGALIAFHKAHGKLATLTGVRPPGRFGAITLDRDRVDHFEEKPIGDGAWINGGFFVLSPKVIDLVDDDATVWEQEPMRKLAKAKEMHAYLHEGFWQCMDTLRDKTYLSQLLEAGMAPWKKW